MNALYIGILWMVYYALHSALATDGIKAYFRNNLPAVYGQYRLLYSFFALVNFLLLFWFHLLLNSELIFQKNLLSDGIGIVFGLLGFLIFILAIRQYPIYYWLGTNGPSNGETLVISGINRWVRHPLYLAVLTLMIAYFLLFPSWKNLVFATVTFLYIIIGALLEERKLIQKYGDEYVAYKHKVKMLVPYLF